mmetsp:Transcript_123277/g.356187  ORF Transcript_123277/g.356187 Transcript_123277/m.356187 type:complete len:222 (-) Transcript_123277:337-1002(-)
MQRRGEDPDVACEVRRPARRDEAAPLSGGGRSPRLQWRPGDRGDHGGGKLASRRLWGRLSRRRLAEPAVRDGRRRLGPEFAEGGALRAANRRRKRLLPRRRRRRRRVFRCCTSWQPPVAVVASGPGFANDLPCFAVGREAARSRLQRHEFQRGLRQQLAPPVGLHVGPASGRAAGAHALVAAGRLRPAGVAGGHRVAQRLRPLPAAVRAPRQSRGERVGAR